MKQTTVETKACCKINIGLNIVEKRPDGYHNIETIFYPVPLYDTLSFRLAEKDSLEVKGIPLEGDPADNLVMKALRSLRDKGYAIPPLKISLSKRIPSGAGLGGGSSDGAQMLKLLNATFQLGLSLESLENLAGSLGADCPFFIRQQPVYATGIGTDFSTTDIALEGMWLILVKPSDFIPTREAYAHTHPHYPEIRLTDAIARPMKEWRNLVVNDFEDSVFRTHPRIQEIKETLYQAGAIYASMSGSGSAVFGLYDQPTHLKSLFEDEFYHECLL